MVHINGRIGSMSYNINQTGNISFREGLEHIQARYPFYDKETLTDEYSNKKYSLQMIEDSVGELLDISEILKIMIFDCLIGNSDRHHSNWGVSPYIKNSNGERYLRLKLCPLYDNGSSLCAYENENDIEICKNYNYSKWLFIYMNQGVFLAAARRMRGEIVDE